MNARAFRQVETKSAHSQVYDILKNAILAGYFRPGEQVTIRGLAAQLGTSEMPVREAIKRLVAQQAIESSPDRKFRIPILDSTQIKDVLELRIMLEGLATEQAAERMTPADIKKTERIHDQMGEAVANNDPQGMLEANIRFHFHIYDRCRNQALPALIESLWLQYSPTLTEYTPRILKHLPIEDQQAARIRNRERHTRVLEALKARDPAAARAHMEADLKAFLSVVDKIGDRWSDDFERRRSMRDYAELMLH
jgi:DNA-binding GntR family transcriptional regulator